MTSVLFFDPVVAPCHAPLFSATCTLHFCYEQRFSGSPFNRLQVHLIYKHLLPSYLFDFFDENFVQGLGFVHITALPSPANLCWPKNGSLTLGGRGSYWWYAAIAGLAFGRLLYVASVLEPVLAIEGQREIQGERDIGDVLDDWLTVNRLRMVNVDLAA